MERHDHDATVLVPQLHMAPALPAASEAASLERFDDLRARKARELGAHAATSTEAMIGGSPAGRGASSK